MGGLETRGEALTVLHHCKVLLMSYSGLLGWMWLVCSPFMIYQVKPFASDRNKNFSVCVTF